jgi:hypothetical protein
MCTRATIKVVNHHWQEYQHQYAREKQPNRLVDVVGEPRVRITIIGDVAIGRNIARTNIIAATMTRDLRSIWQKQDLKYHT